MLRHAGDLFLLVLGIPLVAAGVLAYSALRGREHDAGVRALVAVSVSASIWLTIQVGAFASRYVGQLAERDLIVAAPPLFACLAVWLARGLPRPQPATSIIALAIAVPAVLLPVRALVTPYATPDAFMTVPLARFMDATSGRSMEVAWMIAAALLVVGCRDPARPRRGGSPGHRRTCSRRLVDPRLLRGRQVDADGRREVLRDGSPHVGRRRSTASRSPICTAVAPTGTASGRRRSGTTGYGESRAFRTLRSKRCPRSS